MLMCIRWFGVKVKLYVVSGGWVQKYILCLRDLYSEFYGWVEIIRECCELLLVCPKLNPFHFDIVYETEPA